MQKKLDFLLFLMVCALSVYAQKVTIHNGHFYSHQGRMAPEKRLYNRNMVVLE